MFNVVIMLDGVRLIIKIQHFLSQITLGIILKDKEYRFSDF